MWHTGSPKTKYKRAGVPGRGGVSTRVHVVFVEGRWSRNATRQYGARDDGSLCEEDAGGGGGCMWFPGGRPAPQN